MIDAVSAARAAGHPDRPDLQLLGHRHLRAGAARIFDATVISGDVGLHKPQPEIYELGAERIGVEPTRAASSSTTCARTSPAPRPSG